MEADFILTGISAIVLIYLLTGIYLKKGRHPQKSLHQSLPRVSVLIAMRNEEKNIAHCLEAFEKQTYPDGLFKICIIDDQSDDESPAIARSFTERYDHFEMRTITEEKYGLRGKMNALAQAMEDTDSDIILITDADCIVPRDWIRTFVSYFQENVGLVGGFTLLYPLPDRSVPKKRFGLFDKIQALDWAFLQIVGAYCSYTGKPAAVLGNNFGFRKAAYDEVGGFKKIGFSVTEDYALMRAIKNTGHWKIHQTLDPENTIFSFPVHSLKAFYTQRKRWVTGGKSADLWTYFLMLQTVFIHAALIISLFIHGALLWKGILWAIILGFDYYILSTELNRFRLYSLKRYFLFFELFYFLYTIFFGIVSVFPSRVSWKGRSYK